MAEAAVHADAGVGKRFAALRQAFQCAVGAAFTEVSPEVTDLPCVRDSTSTAGDARVKFDPLL